MQSDAVTIEAYIAALPEGRKKVVIELHKTITKNLPKGFEAGMGYGMMGYVVPHSIYPAGYHCDPERPLPFIGLASQKNSVNLYHMGIFMDKELMEWFKAEYPKHCKTKLDMGKSCIRFKKAEDIPYDLVGELIKKMTVQEWIALYETVLKKPDRKN